MVQNARSLEITQGLGYVERLSHNLSTGLAEIPPSTLRDVALRILAAAVVALPE
jgi:hypothetical protein